MLALLALLGARHSGAAIQFVQSNAAAAGQTLRVPLSAPSTSGDTLIVALAAGVPSCAISDTEANTWAVAVGPTLGVGPLASRYTQIAYAKNIIGGPLPVITMGCADVEALVLEYSGLDPIAPLDVSLAASSSTSTALSCGPVTTTGNNELLIGWALSRGAVTAPGPGFTERLFFDGDVVEDQVVGAAGAYTATATANNPAWILSLRSTSAWPRVRRRAPR